MVRVLVEGQQKIVHREFSVDEIFQYGVLVGDSNPIHTSIEYARKKV